MFRTLRLIFVGFVLSGWLLALSALHILILPGWNFGLVPKDHLGFTDTWVDARNWTAADAAQHPALVKRLIEAGRADWLSSIAGTPGENLDQKLKELLTTPPEDPKSDDKSKKKK